MLLEGQPESSPESGFPLTVVVIVRTPWFRQVLQGVELHIAAGKKVALVGRSVRQRRHKIWQLLPLSPSTLVGVSMEQRRGRQPGLVGKTSLGRFGTTIADLPSDDRRTESKKRACRSQGCGKSTMMNLIMRFYDPTRQSARCPLDLPPQLWRRCNCVV